MASSFRSVLNPVAVRFIERFPGGLTRQPDACRSAHSVCLSAFVRLAEHSSGKKRSVRILGPGQDRRITIDRDT